MAMKSFKVKWKVLLTQIHCDPTRSIIHHQNNLKTVKCHHLHLQMVMALMDHHHHQVNVTLMGHLHHRMGKNTPAMMLTTCEALTPHLRMTWMIMV